MYDVVVNIYIKDWENPIEKTISADTYEEAEERAGQALQVLKNDGFLSDEENEWVYYPTHSIHAVTVKFTESKEENDASGDRPEE